MTEEQMAQVKAMQEVADEHRKRVELQRFEDIEVVAKALDGANGCEYKGNDHGWNVVEVGGRLYRLGLETHNSGPGVFDQLMSRVSYAAGEAVDKVNQELCLDLGRQICAAMYGKVDEIRVFSSSSAAILVMYAGGKKFGVTVTHDEATELPTFYMDAPADVAPGSLHS